VGRVSLSCVRRLEKAGKHPRRELESLPAGMGGRLPSHTASNAKSAAANGAADAELAAAEAERAAAAAALGAIDTEPTEQAELELEAQLHELAEQQRLLAARQEAARVQLVELIDRRDERDAATLALALATERRDRAAAAVKAAQIRAAEAEAQTLAETTAATEAAALAAAQAAAPPSLVDGAVEGKPSCCSIATSAHLAACGAAVERRAGRGRCLVATRALPAGAQVMAAAAVTAVLHPSSWGRRCNCCLSKPSPEIKLLRCSGCRNHFYCCVACQKLDWPSHKRECECLAAATKKHGLAGVALADALLLSRVLHSDQRVDAGQGASFYKAPPGGADERAAAQQSALLHQTVSDLREMEWHEPDVEDNTLLQLAQSAAEAGLLPLEPASASAPVPAARPRSGKKKKGKSGSKGSGAQQAAAAAAIPFGGLRAAAIRLAQFRCNNFGVTDELLVAVGAAIFPAPALRAQFSNAMRRCFSVRARFLTEQKCLWWHGSQPFVCSERGAVFRAHAGSTATGSDSSAAGRGCRRGDLPQLR
jgi:chemotaxis protein histidine kinase CheA